MSATKVGIFLDSNVLLYLLSDEGHKADKVETLLRKQPCISVQVLNEMTQVCVRKLRMSWPDIHSFLALIRHFCTVLPLSVEVHDCARQLAERYQLAFYDACIVAAARLANCERLYSEDMHNGLMIDGVLEIRNPFP
ncbi:PIN domain-containing protein [Neisseriaceae bacterium TC5R-5]|nr:PIN domain-containing protein [Neisseriaceae bacterium TC5R-5]